MKVALFFLSPKCGKNVESKNIFTTKNFRYMVVLRQIKERGLIVMLKRISYFVLCTCVFLMLTGCGNSTTSTDPQETKYTPVNEGALWGTEYDGYKVEVLSYEYDEEWHSYTDEAGVPAICIRFYYENSGEDPLYLLESFGIAAYQDGTELNYISLNSDDDEAMNTTVAVENGAGIYCMMAFETTSDNAAELQITEPTAEAKSLVKLKLEK